MHSLTNSLALLIALIATLLAIAALTLLERKLMASCQLRTGPNATGLSGLLQPIADGLKLISSEILAPQASLQTLYALSPITLFALSLAL